MTAKNTTKKSKSPWQPIKTIPTDGTRVIVGAPGDVCIEVRVIINKDDGETEWYHDNDWFDGQDELTHWMPRPPLPGERKR